MSVTKTECKQIRSRELHPIGFKGQAKLIASFPFQDFQNIMRAGGHYSLWLNPRRKH